MAAATVKSGFGTALKIGDGGGTEVFNPLVEGVTFGGPSQSRDSVDASHMESPSQFKEYISGWGDGGEVKMDGHYLPQNTYHAQLMTDFQAGTVRNFQLYVPSATPKTWSFAAIITRVEPSFPHDGKMTFSATFKISGKPAIA